MENNEILSKEEIAKFLLSLGLTVNFDDNGLIKEIIDNSTGKQLQTRQTQPINLGNRVLKEVVFYNESFEWIILRPHEIDICKQNEIEIIKKKNALAIGDPETRTSIQISYSESDYINSLASIDLMMDKKGVLGGHGISLMQGALGLRIAKNNVLFDYDHQIENENAQMYLQAITNSINETDFIVSNPKIKAELGLIVNIANECVNKLVNIKFQNSERVITELEKRKAELVNQSEKIEAEIKQYETAISQITKTGKTM